MLETKILTFDIPNPFMEGRNRIYVIKSDPLTMIDTGVATEKAYAALVSAMAEEKLQPADIERIVLTHKHIDHIGNAWRIQNESNAEIYIHEFETHAINDVDPSGARYAALIAKKLDQWQVPPDVRGQLSKAGPPPWLIESADVKPVVDGQRLALGQP